MAPFAAASPFAYDLVWRWNEDKLPCACCPASQAMEYGLWTCSQTGREWLTLPADAELWADVGDAAIAAARAAETPQQRAAREAAEAAAEHERELDYEVGRMYGHAQLCGAKNAVRVKGSREVVIRKNDRPCKWLYCDEKVPKSQWRKDENGTLCAPLRNALTGSQCWGHEFVNPKTGKLEKPHKCGHLHPGEAGWRAEWNKDRFFNPALSGGAANGTTVWMSARIAPAAAAKKPQMETAW
jgi:hypothetical protein